MVIAGPAAALGREDRRRDRTPAERGTFRLTRREREVLAVAAEGLTAREIADRLGVRERTVTTHLATDLRQARRRKQARRPPAGSALGTRVDRSGRNRSTDALNRIQVRMLPRQCGR